MTNTNFFGIESANVLNSLAQARDVFATAKSRTVDSDTREEMIDLILGGDYGALLGLVEQAYGVDVASKIIITPESMTTKSKTDRHGNVLGESVEVATGWVIDAQYFQLKQVEGMGIKARDRYNAIAVIMTAFGMVSSTRSEELGTDIKYGCWTRPVNHKGDVLYGDNYTLATIDFGDKRALGSLGGKLNYSIMNRAIELANLLGTKKSTKLQDKINLVNEIAEALGCKVENIKYEAKKFIKGVAASEVILAIANYLYAESDVNTTYLVPKASKEVYALLGWGEPDNVYYLNDQGLVYFDYEADMNDSYFLTMLMKFASQVGRNNFVTVVNTEEGYDVFYEEEYVNILPDGVYDSRGRRFMNVLVTDSRVSEVAAAANDLTLINSHGSYCMTILNSLWFLHEARKGRNSVEPIARWYRFFTNIIPMDSEEESGAMSVGQRGDYNRVATQAYTWRGLLPFAVNGLGATMTGTEKSHDNKFKKDKAATLGQFVKFSGMKSNLSKAALHNFNLVQVHKGNMTFMDASWVTLKAKDIPVKIAKEFITYVITKIYGKSLSEGLFELYFKDADDNTKLLAEALMDDEAKLLELFIHHGHLPLSTKVAKITKRITLAMPSSAEPIDGAMRAFVRIGNVAGVDIGHRYTAGVFPHLLNAPGVMWQLCDKLKPFIVKQNSEESIESYIEDSNQWLFTYRADIVKKGQKTTMSYRDMTTTCTIDTDNFGVEHSGVFVTKDEVILEIPYKTKGGEVAFKTFVADEDCWVKDITWWTLQIGREEVLVVRINWEDVQRNAKLRQTFKALVSRPSSVLWSDISRPELMYNELNDKLSAKLGKQLPSQVDIISTGDSDKSKDLLSGLLDIAAETEVANNRTKKISKLNSMVGMDRSDLLLYHEIFALTGKYDSFMDGFMKRYGRPVWFYNRDAGDAMLRAVREMYGNKSSEEITSKTKWIQRDLAWLHTNCEETVRYDFGTKEVLVVTSNFNGNGVFSDYDEVFVFGNAEFVTDDGIELPEFIWQRTFGFIGTNEDQVYINAKVELCSVDQSVSTSPLMSAVARCVDVGIGDVEGDHATAVSLMADSTKQAADQLKAVNAMVNNYTLTDNEGEPLLKVKLIDNLGVLTAEAKGYLADVEGYEERAKEGDKTLLKDIAAASRDIQWYITDDIYLYLPAILKQSKATEVRQSLSGSVADLFNTVIAGGKFDLLVKRIIGSLEGLVKSKNLAKAVFMGRKSAQNKALGVWGIPLTSYVCIIGSKVYNEIVKAAIDAGIIASFKEAHLLDGHKMFLSRAPLPFPCCLYFHPVVASHPLARLINGSQAGVNPVVAYTSGGDFDGDNYVTTSLSLDSDYPVVTYETIMSVIKQRTGVDGTGKTASAYIADHFIPKGWKKSQVINPTLLQKDNIGLFDGVVNLNYLKEMEVTEDDYNPEEDTCPAFGRYGFDSMMAGSTEVQQILVGAAHKIAVTGEIANGIAQTCYGDLVDYYGDVFASDFNSTFLSAKFLLAVYELYEGGTLGGLAWAAYHAIKLLYTSTLKEIEDVCIEGDNSEFKKALEEASINADHLNSYLQVAESIKFVQELTKANELEVQSKLDPNDKSYFIFSNDTLTVNSVNISGARFVHYVSYLLYLLCGGKFAPECKTEEGITKVNGHAALALIVYMCPRSLWDNMKQHSVAIANLDLFLEECLPVVCADLCLQFGAHPFEAVKGEAKPMLAIDIYNF